MKEAPILKNRRKLQSIEPLKTKIKLNCSDKIHIFPKSDILYLKSDSNYCEVHLVNGNMIYCSQTLKSIEERLDSSLFFRPHQSYVFNIRFLESVRQNMTDLTLSGGIEIPISRRNRQILKRKLTVWFD